MDDLQPPVPGFLDRLMARIERETAQAAPLTSPHTGAAAAVRDRVTQRVADLADDLVALSHDIHADPELGFEEHRAAGRVAALLTKHGHDPVVGAWGLPTAVSAVAGSGRPAVAIIAEYDALPGIGHACGHNVICATAVGAFLALAPLADDLGGRVELIGSPAEEGGGGKELIARAGGFDDLDAAIMLHPSGFEVAAHPWIGVRQVEVTYRGLTAHASATPFQGRNALDAVVQAYTAVAQLRQHMLSTDRVHGIITDGGQKPNIVPERAAATFYVRSAEPETLALLSERVEAIFAAAALSTGTTATINWDPCPVYLPVRNNLALAARYAANMTVRDRRVLPMGIVPEYLTGSTDMGNVSVRVPSIHPTLKIAPAHVSIHTPEFARCAVSAPADRGTLDGAFGLAMTAADMLADPQLRNDAAGEFAAAGGRMDPDPVQER